VGPLSALLSLFLAVFFPRDRGNVFRVDDAQDVLNDLPFGQFGEGPHAVDMGAKGALRAIQIRNWPYRLNRNRPNGSTG
jgi:hypothetical protein